MIGRAVQRIVEGFGDFKKVFAPGHDVPFEVEVQFLSQGHQPIENLRHSPANSRRVNHLHAAAAQRLRQGAQFLDFTRTQELGVVAQRDACEGQGFAHAFLPSLSISRNSLERELSSVFV